MKILVLKRDKLGDLLLTTPMLAALKTAIPACELHMVASDYSAWVLDGNPHIDKLWAYPRTRTGKRRHPIGVVKQGLQIVALRRERFDYAIAAGGDDSHRAIKRLLLMGARETIAITDTPQRYPRLTHALPAPRATRHESARMADLLAPILARARVLLPELTRPTYVLPQTAAAFAKHWLTQQGLATEEFIVLGLGARRAKRQPTANQVLELADYAWRRHKLATVLMWTPGKSTDPLYPGDDDIAQPVLEAQRPYIKPFRGPIKEALGLIWSARTSVFPDSGLMHFASASPGGVLGLFADIQNSPAPDQWGPVGPKSGVLVAEKIIGEIGKDAMAEALDQQLARAGAVH